MGNGFDSSEVVYRPLFWSFLYLFLMAILSKFHSVESICLSTASFCWSQKALLNPQVKTWKNAEPFVCFVVTWQLRDPDTDILSSKLSIRLWIKRRISLSLSVASVHFNSAAKPSGGAWSPYSLDLPINLWV